MFKLYILVNQVGALDGEKTLQGSYASLAAAQAAAGVTHYSVEQVQLDGSVSVVYVV